MAVITEDPQADVQAFTVDHRGARLQAHVGHWGDNVSQPRRPHLHVQDYAGGAGRIVPLDQDVDGAYTDALARELTAEHDDLGSFVSRQVRGLAPAKDAPLAPATDPQTANAIAQLRQEQRDAAARHEETKAQIDRILELLAPKADDTTGDTTVQQD